MDMLANLALGFQTAMSLSNLLYCLIGVFLGTAIGVLPGIGPIATIAMLLPITFGLPPVSALIMLAGIYYGAQYGGSTTAILVNLPGESSSVVTALDGYQMARQGKAGPALATAAIGSFFAGTVCDRADRSVRAAAGRVALQFGPAEYFSLMVLGLVASIVLAQRLAAARARRWSSSACCSGSSAPTSTPGVARYSFGFPQLADGIGFVVIAMGMFGLAEIVAQSRARGDAHRRRSSRSPDCCRRARTGSGSSARSCAARCSAPPWASCRAAARSWRRLRPIRSKRSSRRRRNSSARAPSKAWPARNPPTTPEPRRRSSRC